MEFVRLDKKKTTNAKAGATETQRFRLECEGHDVKVKMHASAC